LGFITLATDVYLIWRFRYALRINVAIVLALPIGLQLIYQWWRALRYFRKVRELYSAKLDYEAKDGTPLDAALRVATGGISDILFYCYGIELMSLVVIWWLLKHFGM
jgi:hypothetical protein